MSISTNVHNCTSIKVDRVRGETVEWLQIEARDDAGSRIEVTLFGVEDELPRVEGTVMDSIHKANRAADKLRLQADATQAALDLWRGRFGQLLELANRADDSGELSTLERQQLEELNRVHTLAVEGQQELPDA